MLVMAWLKLASDDLPDQSFCIPAYEEPLNHESKIFYFLFLSVNHANMVDMILCSRWVP
jgi:hypothetical protein